MQVKSEKKILSGPPQKSVRQVQNELGVAIETKDIEHLKQILSEANEDWLTILNSSLKEDAGESILLKAMVYHNWTQPIEQPRQGGLAEFHHQAVKLLIEAGADSHSLFERSDGYCLTPFIRACQFVDVDNVHYLISLGVDIFQKDSWGEPALWAVVLAARNELEMEYTTQRSRHQLMQDCCEVAYLLLEHGVKWNPEDLNRTGQTLKELAEDAECLDIYEAFLAIKEAHDIKPECSASHAPSIRRGLAL